MTDRRRATPKSIRTREAIEAAARELFCDQWLRADDGARHRRARRHRSVDDHPLFRQQGCAVRACGDARICSCPISSVGDPAHDRRNDWCGISWSSGKANRPAAACRCCCARRPRMRRPPSGCARSSSPRSSRPSPAPARRKPRRLRAGLVATQLLGLALARYVLRLPPVVAMPGTDRPHHRRDHPALRDRALSVTAKPLGCARPSPANQVNSQPFGRRSQFHFGLNTLNLRGDRTTIEEDAGSGRGLWSR